MSVSVPGIEDRARALLARLTPAERIRMLAGDHDLYGDMLSLSEHGATPPLWSAAGVPRLGLSGFRMSDGPRGVTHGVSTCFPVAMARAAAFDYALEEQVGEAIGREARAKGANVCLAPCINLLRHPGWGRAQETYGEIPVHLGEMGAAFVRGLQRYVLGCVKHFACNSIEESRLQVDVRVAPDVLETIYLPHFRRVVGEGVGAVMSAYNSLNGHWCGQNQHLLTKVLKEEWSFDGFVVSDWVFGIRDGVAALNAGLDLEMPSPLFINDKVARALARGSITRERLDDAALRLIRQQLRAASLPGGTLGPEVIACPEHRALARETAVKSIVLLRNEPMSGAGGQRRPLLPLDPAGLSHLAVIGRLAAEPNTGDRGSSNVTPPYVVTPLEGLRAALEPLGVRVSHDDGAQPARAAALAAEAGAVIVVAGYDWRDEGEFIGTFPPPGFEGLLPRPPLRALPRVLRAAARARRHKSGLLGGGDRRSLTLRPEDEELVLRVAAANPRTAVALVCGSAVLMERWRHSVPGILILWYAGMEGGHALADIVLGRERPSGRLPFAIPTSTDHLPPFDPSAAAVEYGPLHGQALLDHLGVRAAYPYGFGHTY